MNAALGEVETTDNLTGKTFCAFTLLEAQSGEDNDRTLFAEVALRASLATRSRDGSQVRVRIPYTPDIRELQVRLRTDRGASMPEYRLNPETNRPWYGVAWEDSTGALTPVKVSEIWRCNGNGVFNLVLRGGALVLYSGAETDLMLRPALGQNEVFLLKAFAGNLYQFPTTGVGLSEYLHANLESSGLASKLRSEFTDDKMIIHNAYMDSTTGELILDVTEKDG